MNAEKIHGENVYVNLDEVIETVYQCRRKPADDEWVKRWFEPLTSLTKIKVDEYVDKEQAYMDGYAKGVVYGGLLKSEVNEDYISREQAIDAIDEVDWYQVNPIGKLVHGAASDETALYKAKDIYRAIESLPSITSNTVLKTHNDESIETEKVDERCKGCKHYKLTCNLFSEICKYEPSAERSKGEWLPIIEATEMGEPYIAGIYCSECGETLRCEANYCPNCGAKMKGVHDE